MSTLDKWDPIARDYNPLKAGSIDGRDTIPHDHGIVRAIEAEYIPNSLVVGDSKATVFVGQLHTKTCEDTLRKIFSHYGEIRRLRLIRDVVTGFSKGYAFIEYNDRYDAVKAQNNLHRTLVDDKEIIVDAECERTLPGWIPRRLGGGLSGKKESGQLRFGGKVRPFKKPILVKELEKIHGEHPYDSNAYDRKHRSKYHSHNANDDRGNRSKYHSYDTNNDDRGNRRKYYSYDDDDRGNRSKYHSYDERYSNKNYDQN